MTYKTLSGVGENIAEGIKTYSENQRKSEAADATIASGVARFKSIADVYAQDPEFAPIVAQYAQRLEQYKDAPNQSYAKKAVMANEVNMLGQELAQTLQAQQMVRGRQIERVGSELINQFPNVNKVTDPAVIKEGTSKFNTGKDYGSNEGEFITGLNRFRQAAQAVGKEIKGSDAEALDAYRRDVLDSTNKAMSAGTLDRGIGSRIIEQVEAQRSIEKKNAQAQSDMPMLPSQMRSSRKAYESVTGTAYQSPEQAQAGVERQPRKYVSAEEAKSAGKKAVALEKEIDQLFGAKAELSPLEEKKMSKMMAEVNALKETAASVGVDDMIIGAYAPVKSQVTEELKALAERESLLTKQVDIEKRTATLRGGKTPIEKTAENAWNNIAVPAFRDKLKQYSKVDEKGEVTADWGKMLRNTGAIAYSTILGPVGTMLITEGAFDAEKPLAERVKIAKSIEEGVKKSGPEQELADVQSRIRSLKTTLSGIQTSEVQKPAGPAAAPAPVLSLGRMNVGQIEYERKVNQAEKKAKIADLMTQRIGTVDPVTGKKTLPVGFDAYYKKMVPESDARVVDIDGVKLLWDGSKFEQVKMEQPKQLTNKEIGENSAYTFGIQTANGIQGTELVPNSGVYISGIVSAASTSMADKVRENLTDLIDLRGSVARLTSINDKFGESLSLRDQGISQYDLMKLRAVLTKQINVSGSISDEERRAINKMTPDATEFLDLEPKTRAALLGIAQGIDRDLKTLATSRGLSVEIRENGGMTQNQSLRQKFLSKQPQ
ncbi:hypothetical protein UFOVP460_15 [uncultured Caudovirales phage]|uniref:Uncharacterized protein n=1 Tax=uncultured Caudovirales phage TaxID=2100421 RepID=A0A6J5MAK0_9CAUD|nr:hypothetical protein UFOVP460_15 [uncultured Caudovirales phage]